MSGANGKAELRNGPISRFKIMNQPSNMASRRLLAGLAALTLGTVAAQAQATPPVLAYWDFERVEADGVSIKSTNGKYVGTINDAAKITEAGGGRPGGGRGFDVSQANSSRGYILLEATGDDNPMNLAAADDAVTIVLWQKNFSNVNSSSFWFVADSQGRGIQAHVPWSNGRIYLDSNGCCSAPSQRLDQAAPDGFDWTTWHHYAFVKNKEAKQIYIDGELLAEQTEGVGPLPTDFTQLFIGSASDKNAPDGIIDDFAIFKGALSQKDIQAIVKGGPIGAPPVDTDKDGMPDTWEVDYGFNPNDPSDAAKDFDKDGATNVQEFVAGTNPIDVTKPVLVSAATSGDFKTVTLTFSESVDAASATALANYKFTPALAVTAASVKKNVVTLTTAAQTPGAVAYTVTVNNVVDTSKNAVATDSKASFYSFLNIKDGVLKFSFWGGISGNPVDNLYQDPRWPASPDWTGAVFSFNSRDILPNDAKEAYGASIEGYLTPSESGNYRFFIYSDDSSQFFISSDDKEANLTQVAEETGCCNFFTEPDSPRTSEPVALTAGKKYFVRMVYKEGGGGDYGQIAWRKEGDATAAGKLAPIPGKFLSSAVDLPADPAGAYTQVSPAPNAKGVSPAASITISHRDGKTPWTAANVTLKYDGQSVSPTVTKDGNILTIKYSPTALAASGSTHTVSLGYLDAGGQPATYDFVFTSGTYNGTTLDKVGGYPGLLMGGAVFTADAGGVSGKAGDRAVDLTKKGGPVVSFDKAMSAAINKATANDELTVAFWQKKWDTADSSAFAVNSPTAPYGRLFHSHAPWSNQNIYFDTMGCCDGGTQRISADIQTFSGYSGDASWWTSAFHHFVFTKKGSTKNIWIDGKLFLTGENTAALGTDVDAFYMGAGGNGGEPSHAIIDDFAIFGKELVEADVVALSKGTAPSGLAASKGLIAYWDFNSAPVAGISNLKATAGANGKVKVTFDGAGTLQTSTSLTGTYADSAIKSGDQITVDGAALFIRAKR